MEGITQTIAEASSVDAKTLLLGFREDCRLRGMTSESIRRYLSNDGIFVKYIESRGVSLLQVGREILKDFLRYLRFERNASQATLEAYFSHVSSLYEYLVYERVVQSNPVLEVRKRYLRTFKEDGGSEAAVRKLISTEDLRMLVNSILDPRDKAIVVLLAKTGIRRNELRDIDLEEINWSDRSITLKPKAKRNNRIVFFDEECERVLREWLSFRDKVGIGSHTGPLFVGQMGSRLNRTGIYSAVAKWAEKVGLHEPASKRLEDHFSPHCLRHWFTTELRRAGMPREYVKELRGDTRGETMDLYYHIDKEELRRAYLAFIPKLEIE